VIPWLIVYLVDVITSLFGYDMTVRCRSDRRWGVEAFWLRRRPAGQPRPGKVGRYRGGPIEPGEMLAIPAGLVGTTHVEMIGSAAWLGALPDRG